MYFLSVCSSPQEIRQLQQKQAGFIREISDLQETIEWKDKKIGVGLSSLHKTVPGWGWGWGSCSANVVPAEALVWKNVCMDVHATLRWHSMNSMVTSPAYPGGWNHLWVVGTISLFLLCQRGLGTTRPCREKGSGQLDVEDQTSESPWGFMMRWGAACHTPRVPILRPPQGGLIRPLSLLSKEGETVHPHLGGVNRKSGPHQVTAGS